MLDTLLLLAAACIVGLVQGYKWDLGGVTSNITMTYLVLAVLSCVVHLRAFSSIRHVQGHEHSVGVSPFATFFSLNITELGWIAISPAIYLAVYYYMVTPRAPFADYYVIGLLVCWWNSGMAYAVSLSPIPPQAQQVFSAILTLILGAFLNGLSPSIRSARGSVVEAVLGLSYNRWATEAAIVQVSSDQR
ncbi:hypothetical protein GPECTOR_73g644 [Gonium pectorale]|uniref:ABC transporter family G domain-containing protein n=1 Tax=Gonium pectorale TaxID=33097 RepID=A0A150G2T4_GONPE|nr:hypothetical protein GPECTOR_73g644 [Gonium pectorale]|eukprot:KXZ44123.1 hypothetical protein GPECTOR_73g644 [Gonium pectorale]